jgi:site-specific DNA recombinase
MIKPRRQAKATDSEGLRRQGVVYARVSSAEQEKEGFSIPAQLRLLHEYAAQRGIEVVQEFVDVETAKKAGRANFNQMLAFLEESDGIRTVLVEKTDRLYRNFRDYVTIDDLDLEIHLVKESEILGRDSRSHQKFIHGIKVLMAKNYIDNLSEETRKGMSEKVAGGGFPHRAPMGYLNDSTTKTIIVDREKAPAIQRLFEWYASGEFSLRDIHARCVEDGLIFPGRKGIVSRSKIEYLLKNPFYVGQVRWAGRLYAGTHESIINQHLFDRVQARFLSHDRPRGSRPGKEFAFGGLMRCGECGYQVTAMLIKKRYVYYKCTNTGGKCTQAYFNERDLAPAFESIVRRVELAPKVVDWVIRALKESVEDEAAYNDEEQAKVTRSLEEIRRKERMAWEDRSSGRITEDLWADMTSDWAAERSRLVETMRGHDRAQGQYLEVGVRIVEEARRVAAFYEATDAEPAARRHLLATILEDCQLKDGEVAPIFRPVWATVAAMAAEKEVPPSLAAMRRWRAQSSKTNIRGVARKTAKAPARAAGQPGNRTQNGPDPASSKIERWGG